MQVTYELGYPVVDLDQCVGKFYWVAGGVANAVYTFDIGNIGDQFGKVAHRTIQHIAAVGIDILAEQINLANTLSSQLSDLGEHIGHGTADFFASGIGHYAKCAVFGAAFHYRDKGAGAVDFRCWQPVKFFNFRKTDINHNSAVCFAGFHHLWQAMQSLWAKDHIDKGCSLGNCLAFLTGNTAAHANHKFWISFFKMFPAAKLMKDLFLSFFAN